MPSVLLPVPHLPQEKPHSRLEACARMVLAYLGGKVYRRVLSRFRLVEVPANSL